MQVWLLTPQILAAKEALVEAFLKAKEFGFGSIIAVTNYDNLTKICNGDKKPQWQERVLLTDLKCLKSQGMNLTTISVPNFVLHPTFVLVEQATKTPIHHNWGSPELCNAGLFVCLWH